MTVRKGQESRCREFLFEVARFFLRASEKVRVRSPLTLLDVSLSTELKLNSSSGRQSALGSR